MSAIRRLVMTTDTRTSSSFLEHVLSYPLAPGFTDLEDHLYNGILTWARKAALEGGGTELVIDLNTVCRTFGMNDPDSAKTIYEGAQFTRVRVVLDADKHNNNSVFLFKSASKCAFLCVTDDAMMNVVMLDKSVKCIPERVCMIELKNITAIQTRTVVDLTKQLQLQVNKNSKHEQIMYDSKTDNFFVLTGAGATRWSSTNPHLQLLLNKQRSLKSKYATACKKLNASEPPAKRPRT